MIVCKGCDKEGMMTSMLMLLDEKGREEYYCPECCIEECNHRGVNLTKVPLCVLDQAVDILNMRTTEKLRIDDDKQHKKGKKI